jgi:nucleotidyltransferase/DNA polymerase involved in DNA repair
MSIACVIVPYFATAVERRDDPSLDGAPLVIGALLYERGEVYARSREAAEMGVKRGMTLRQAEALCPEAVFISPSEMRYSQVFEELAGILERFTHIVEPDGLGCAYLDMGDLGQGEAIEVVQRIGQAVREEVHLAAAIGLAGGKFTAHVAASCVDSDQALIIAPGREREFLQGFPVELLPMDEDMARRLRLLGIGTLGQLAALPTGAVLAQFGKKGHYLQRLAMGHDDHGVIPRHKKEAERSQRVFDHPVDDLTILEAIAWEMAQGLVTRLQTSYRMCRELRVAIEFEDGTTREEGLIFSQPTFSREKITLNLSQLLGRIDCPCGVVSLEIVLGDIAPETGKQLDLFVNRVEQEARLRCMLRDLMAKYGSDRFYRASLVDREARLPERRFILLEVDPQ